MEQSRAGKRAGDAELDQALAKAIRHLIAEAVQADDKDDSSSAAA